MTGGQKLKTSNLATCIFHHNLFPLPLVSLESIEKPAAIAATILIAAFTTTQQRKQPIALSLQSQKATVHSFS